MRFSEAASGNNRRAVMTRFLLRSFRKRALVILSVSTTAFSFVTNSTALTSGFVSTQIRPGRRFRTVKRFLFDMARLKYRI